MNQFYKPDTAATGQLLADVAEKLIACGHEVDVICARSGYNGGAIASPRQETIGGVRVHRVTTTRFGRLHLVGRLFDYLSFYFGAAWRAIVLPRPDLCVSLTTPPFIALIGWVLSKVKRTRSVLWVMDVYPEIAVAYDVLPRKGVLVRLFKRINRLLYRDARAVVSLGEAMTAHLKAIGVPEAKLHTVHNWVPGERLM